MKKLIIAASLLTFIVSSGNANASRYKADELNRTKSEAKINPHSAEAYYNIGVAYHRDLGMHKEAIEAFKQAIVTKPDMAEAYFGLGNAYGNIGMYKEEVEAYRQAVRIKPDYAVAYYNLGVVYGGNLKMYEEAIAAFKQATAINPGDSNTHYNLGIVYLLLHDRDSALGEYKILKRLSPELANKIFVLIHKSIASSKN